MKLSLAIFTTYTLLCGLAEARIKGRQQERRLSTTADDGKTHTSRNQQRRVLKQKKSSKSSSEESENVIMIASLADIEELTELAELAELPAPTPVTTYPPQAVTMWWVFANNPSACLASPESGVRCGPLDVLGQAFLDTLNAGIPNPLLIAPNSDAQIGIVYATGGVTDEYGNIRLVASNYLSSPTVPLAIDVSIDPIQQQTGFINAGAEVGVVVKTHGTYIGDPLQFTELLDPYCDDPVIGWKGPMNNNGNLCVEVQNAVFAPGMSGTQVLNEIYTDPAVPVEHGMATLVRRGDALQAIVEANIFDTVAGGVL